MNDRQQNANLSDKMGKDYWVKGVLHSKQCHFGLDHISEYLRLPLFGVVEPWGELGPAVKVFHVDRSLEV